MATATAETDELIKEIEVPDGVDIAIQEDTVTVKGPRGEVKRRLVYPGIEILKRDRKILVKTQHPKKRQRAMVGTFASHINNMIKGVLEGFEYRMKILYSHFPITVKVSGKEALVENYLGEKIPRRIKIFGDCDVKVKGNEITITGNNVEEVGQTAANIEMLTRAKNKDKRVFQDGIYLVERNGVRV